MDRVFNVRDRIRELRRVPATELLENPKNWREHPAGQQSAMAEMLNKIGFADALKGRDTEEGLELLDGHLRKDIAPDSTIPVLILDLNDEEAEFFLTTYDPLGAMASVNSDRLEALLADVNIETEELETYLRGLLNKDEEDGPELVPEDDDIPDSAPPISKLGYLWKLGDHYLYVGSALEAETYDKLLGDDLVDAVWTDPPYGVDYTGKTKDALKISNDAMTIQETENFLRSAFTEANSHCKGGAVWWVAAPPGPPTNLAFSKVLTDLDIWRQTIAWVKDVFVMGYSDYHWKHENLFYGWTPGAAHHTPSDRKQDTVWEVPRPKASKVHPTQKPVELVARSLLNSSDRGDLVLDPFGGSGTTLIACEKLDRRCRMAEIDPRYADVICRRYQELTGTHAVLASTGEIVDFTQDFFEAQAEAMAQGKDEPLIEEFGEPEAVPELELVDIDPGF